MNLPLKSLKIVHEESRSAFLVFSSRPQPKPRRKWPMSEAEWAKAVGGPRLAAILEVSGLVECVVRVCRPALLGRIPALVPARSWSGRARNERTYTVALAWESLRGRSIPADVRGRIFISPPPAIAVLHTKLVCGAVWVTCPAKVMLCVGLVARRLHVGRLSISGFSLDALIRSCGSYRHFGGSLKIMNSLDQLSD